MPDQPTAEERYTPRQMLALIALATAPTPRGISIHADHDTITIHCYNLTDGAAWAHYLGAEVSTPDEHGGARWLRVTPAQPEWHGWRIALTAAEDLPAEEPLDVDTAEQLRAVAEGGEPQ